MTWISANQILPPANEEVLIRTRADVNLAVYNAERKRFELKNGAAFDVHSEKVSWMALQKK